MGQYFARHSNRSQEPPKKIVTLHQVENLGFGPRPFTCIFSHVVKTINHLRIRVETNLARVAGKPRRIALRAREHEGRNVPKDKSKDTKVCSVLALVGVGAGIKSLSHLVN
eukprot:sb/3477120/